MSQSERRVMATWSPGDCDMDISNIIEPAYLSLFHPHRGLDLITLFDLYAYFGASLETPIGLAAGTVMSGDLALTLD